jgi:DNA-binding NarL/FixJ family response regulator
MSNEIQIIIADDHPVLRKGLRDIIEEDSSLKVIAEVEDGETAFEQIVKLQPQIAILDIKMPKMNGFEVVHKMRDSSLNVAVILLTMHNDAETLHAALNMGIEGFVSKDSALTEIIASIKAVASGNPYISPSLSKYLVRRFNQASKLTQEYPSLKDLTPTEIKVLRLIAECMTSSHIGEALNMHPRTVDNHRTNISHKLGLHGTHALVKFAIEHKNDLP